MGGASVMERRSSLSREVPFNRYVADYLSYNKELLIGIREGLEARRQGKVRPWRDIKKELSIG